MGGVNGSAWVLVGMCVGVWGYVCLFFFFHLLLQSLFIWKLLDAPCEESNALFCPSFVCCEFVDYVT